MPHVANGHLNVANGWLALFPNTSKLGRNKINFQIFPFDLEHHNSVKNVNLSMYSRYKTSVSQPFWARGTLI